MLVISTQKVVAFAGVYPDRLHTIYVRFCLPLFLFYVIFSLMYLTLHQLASHLVTRGMLLSLGLCEG